MAALEASGKSSSDALDISDHEIDTADQFLTFIMAGEEYGVDILSVQEIRGWENATPIPNSPTHVKGVINLRGTIVPIVDLRTKFGMKSVDYGPLTVVIVLKVETAKGSKVMGIVVDAVSDVYNLSREELKEAPDLGDKVNTAFLKGLVNVQGKMVILLDIDKLLGQDDIPDVSEISKKLAEADI
jgi:purine-binding chemotaxis protein CheW